MSTQLGIFNVRRMGIPDLNGKSLKQINELLATLSTSARPMTRSELEKVLASQTIMVIARSRVQGIVGMASLVVCYQPIGIVCHVEDVVVMSGMQGNGIGRMLMEELLKHVPPGTRQVDLTSNLTRVPAHRLYESLGFVLRETGNYRWTPPRQQD